MTEPTRHLCVSDNGRYLQYRNGEPFLYLADTAWELLHRLDLSESKYYLRRRAVQGFTTIQTVIIGEQDGLHTPNANGDCPLCDDDPTQPTEAYFQHVDAVVDVAAEMGLTMALLPTWGAHWKSKNGGTAIFTPESALSYGRFLGQRYVDSPVIWVLGGDRVVEGDKQRAVLDAMAEGLRQGDQGNHLITFHPCGPGHSSSQLHDAKWLDFNMIQSSHAARDHDNGLMIERDYGLLPVKPTLDGEPRYETIPIGFYNSDTAATRRFDDYDCRQAAYWAMLAGACGHTYGNNNVWQMWTPAREPAISANIPWYEAINHVGAVQMGYLHKLFQSHSFHKLAPCQEMLIDAPCNGGAKVRAACASDGQYALVYSPRGEQFTVEIDRIKTERVRMWWFDPRYGSAHLLHTTDTLGCQTFVPPTSGRGCDWILVLDDADASLPDPGAKA